MAIGTDFIDLQWCSAVDNVAVCGYKLYYDDGTLIADIGLGQSYTVSGLTDSTEYCFYYTAYDCAGNESLPSESVCATTIPDYIDMIFGVDTNSSLNFTLAPATFTGTTKTKSVAAYA